MGIYSTCIREWSIIINRGTRKGIEIEATITVKGAKGVAMNWLA